MRSDSTRTLTCRRIRIVVAYSAGVFLVADTYRTAQNTAIPEKEEWLILLSTSPANTRSTEYCTNFEQKGLTEIANIIIQLQIICRSN